MDILSRWGDALSAAITQFLEQLGSYLPSILGAFLLLLIGWFAARLLRSAAMRLAGWVERWFGRWSANKASGAPRLPGGSAAMLGSIVFWVVLLFFLTAATQVLGLEMFTAWLSRVVDYVPTLLAGGLIVLAGVLLSRLARSLIEVASPASGEKQRALLGKTVQTVILIIAILVGVEQIGIKTTFLVVAVATVVAAVVGAVTLAVSLGARSYVANLIGSHYLRHAYSAGQKIRVAGFEGRILDVTATSLVLETEQGRVSLPGKVFNDEPIVLLGESAE